MFRDRDSDDGLTVVTGRPAWQKSNEAASEAAKQAATKPANGAGSPAAPVPAAKAPDTAKPAGPLVATPVASTTPVTIVQAADAPAKPKRSLSRKAIAAAALLAVLGVGGWYGHYYWTAGRYLVSTDDAYVGAKNTTLAAK